MTLCDAYSLGALNLISVHFWTSVQYKTFYQKRKDTTPIITNHKRTRMIKDGED